MVKNRRHDSGEGGVAEFVSVYVVEEFTTAETFDGVIEFGTRNVRIGWLKTPTTDSESVPIRNGEARNFKSIHGTRPSGRIIIYEFFSRRVTTRDPF